MPDIKCVELKSAEGEAGYYKSKGGVVGVNFAVRLKFWLAKNRDSLGESRL
jgi:hypothetical protein